MGLLHNVTTFQPPRQPAGNPVELAEIRELAYEGLFLGAVREIFPHDLFEKPRSGGRIEVRVYELQCEAEFGSVQVAVTSGMSDYRMMPPDGGRPYRREVIQYLRDSRIADIARLHGVAWLPLASHFPLDYFQTVEPLPGEFPASLFIPSLVTAHADFKLHLNGDETRLLWHIPLRPEEIAYKLKYGVDALLARMKSAKLPWIFEAFDRPPVL